MAAEECYRWTAYSHVLLNLLPVGLDVDVAAVGRHQDCKGQVLDRRVIPCQ